MQVLSGFSLVEVRSARPCSAETLLRDIMRPQAPGGSHRGTGSGSGSGLISGLTSIIAVPVAPGAGRAPSAAAAPGASWSGAAPPALCKTVLV